MLEPISPEEAVEQYLEHRQTDLSELSLQNHGYRLNRFLEWCEKAGVEDMNRVTGRTIHEYKVVRSKEVNPVTLKTQLTTLRVFLRFCENIDAVAEGVSEKVPIPDLDYGEDARRVMVIKEEAEAILDHFDTFDYASFGHVTFYLLWYTGMRVGTARGIDVDDYHPEEEYINIAHRPETGTPLKNKERGEREVHVKRKVCNVIDDYLQFNHAGVKDEFGRMPLFSTRSGRASTTALRKNVYAATRPCVYTNECPHQRNINDCEATDYAVASKCPSSVSPHALRRGSITAHLNAGIDKWVVSGRMDVSTEVLEKHYDNRTRKERRKGRKNHLSNI